MSSSQDTVRPDLLLKGGHVIDPLNGRNAPADVAITGGRITGCGQNLSTEGVGRVLDVSGCYVTPGIVDLHAHVCASHPRSTLSLDPHVHTFSSGVTTVVD